MNPIIDFGEIFIFVALLFASIIALAVGLERAIVYNKNSSKSSGEFMKGLAQLLRARDIRSAAEFAKQGEDHIYSRFSIFSLSHYNSGRTSLDDLMAGKIIEEKIELEKRLTILNTLGNNAPFIGLLGTVLGVIKAFYGLGTLGNTGAEVVMRSISSALIATAAGLGVAIPVVMANNYFTRKMKIILQNLEILAKEFLASLNGKSAEGTKD